MTGHGGHGGAAQLPPFSLDRGLDVGGDGLFLAGCVAVAVLYGWGVVRLRRNGDAWPWGRCVAFGLGVVCVAVVTGTGLNAYGMVLFSVHMVQHMVLSMLAPVLLLLGAPVTLALRALPRAGASGGVRRAVVRVVRSRVARVVSSPLFSIPLFVASLYGLYFTPLFDSLMATQTGHRAMMLHFLAVGLVFFWPVMGVDPGPHRAGFPLRILGLFATMPFHAFFGIALMMASEPMVESFATPPPSLAVEAVADQSAAGGIAWAFSEVPSVVVLVVLVVQWYVSDLRAARRLDRAAERGGEGELVAYNAWLAGLGSR
jgi:cytochrome c oxidase assembly factor CtaG